MAVMPSVQNRERIPDNVEVVLETKLEPIEQYPCGVQQSGPPDLRGQEAAVSGSRAPCAPAAPDTHSRTQVASVRLWPPGPSKAGVRLRLTREGCACLGVYGGRWEEVSAELHAELGTVVTCVTHVREQRV